ncbi:MAG TPA: aminoacetone oxidase family FAD-binding enzyme [Longimicrobiales bacterium]|nr:aminoacetone oxidase family FAD-binding enzyme [Longimicrobiales bacterium]
MSSHAEPGGSDHVLPIAVVGAGAAGLMAALFAARSGADVILLERTEDGGRKILISGGGRCNILPSVVQPQRYVTDSSPNTLRKILSSWPLAEQIAFFEDILGMPLEREPETGKLFPSSHKARDVRDALVASAREAGARIWFGARVTNLVQEPGTGEPSTRAPGPRWRIEIEESPPLHASAVILATGGLSVPATGSDGGGLAVARRLGHEVHATYPALTPLTAQPHPHAALSGVSLTVTLRAPGAKPPFETTDGFLITHRGWSGPSVLDASHLAIRGRPDGGRQELMVQWTPRSADGWTADLAAGGQATVRSTLAPHLPRRLADHLCAEAAVDPETRLSQLRREGRLALVAALTAYPLPWTGDEGYKKAEVTGGGVALSEVDPRTMESRRARGLYLCGEILDAFGPIGGHNFLWAWATGRAAGSAAAARTRRT